MAVILGFQGISYRDALLRVKQVSNHAGPSETSIAPTTETSAPSTSEADSRQRADAYFGPTRTTAPKRALLPQYPEMATRSKASKTVQQPQPKLLDLADADTIADNVRKTVGSILLLLSDIPTDRGLPEQHMARHLIYFCYVRATATTAPISFWQERLYKAAHNTKRTLRMRIQFEALRREDALSDNKELFTTNQDKCQPEYPSTAQPS